MASRIQSVDMACGEPVMAVAPQVYVRGTSPLFSPDVQGVDLDLAAAPGVATVADLNGFRGAIVTIYHSTTTTSNATSIQQRLRHGATATYSEHDYVSSDLLWAFLQPGIGAGGASGMFTFLVDASRIERYLSVEGFISNGLGAFQAASITPIGPLNAKSGNVSQSNNLFITSSGTQSFPNLNPA